MQKTKIDKKHVKASLELTGRIIDECGPRLAGTDACRKSALLLKKEIDRFADSSAIEEFEVRPNAFLGFMKVATVAYIISSLLLFFGYLIPAALGYTFSIFITVTQFVFYFQTFDPFYKKKTGYNVIGTIEPQGKVKQQIIVSGHHDSAYVFNFFTYFPKLYRIRIILGFAPIDLAFVLTWIWIVIHYVYGITPFYSDILRYGVIASFILTGQLFFFTGKKGTPGAGDNLISTSISFKIGEIFSRKKNKGKSPLKNTRLIIASFDAEESGLRGARAYARRHREEFRTIPTCNFNLDSIYDVGKIKFLISDINGLRRLSKKMAAEGLAIARRLGYDAKFFRFLFGAGGTDAAEFAKIGVEATTLIAMPISVEKDFMVYHTADDTIEHVQPEAVEAVLKIIHTYIVEMDEKVRKN